MRSQVLNPLNAKTATVKMITGSVVSTPKSIEVKGIAALKRRALKMSLARKGFWRRTEND